MGEDTGDLVGYDADDVARFLPEPPKNPQRTPFERDRARVLHSSALRRLGAKTQVLGPSADDFVRTRLTHSLEVAQVGRALGQALGCDPDVVDAACLSHDLGHPPYGHNGEQALNVVAESIGGFEGNAQTFRILTRLEPKTVDGHGRGVGVNLTRASLDAVAKYPWAKGEGPGGPGGRSAVKYCCYDDDREIFSWMRAGAPANRRCLEAQIMDFSDDVGYSVHDVEDAIALFKMDPARLADPAEVVTVVDATRAWYGGRMSADALGAAWERLAAQPFWIHSYTGALADAAQLKNLTSQLIGRFVSAVARATREVFGEGPLTRYDADLVIPEETAAEILVLKGAAVRYVMAPREHEPVYLRQRTELFDLADALLESNGEHLEPIFAAAWHEAADDAGRLRAVVDQIASLTDTSAQAWHARLCGLLSAV
ncbi:deoxyguanosinetriphosphate triphosphohydrolase [Actinomyces succiniciruminis]|uniref:Deoxyguanosinetriphosphate triphosphohydrolase-like protein n=1 Tax=Actinomyces succiniciruminis TaxID=1522002 RepID=A0A1L7RLT2_9ACTO|nr:deoxyguanosinetriphosphate triphosphohydrolase [Actinomyces succiniciruminis]CED91140.1 Deoxyguanosinetriphosphate triphosphohydrolase-like protein [Actinomyces succiniciruminis]